MPQSINLDEETGGVVTAGKNQAFVGRPIGRLHTFYLSGTIGDPEEYSSWVDLIRNAQPNDVIYIHINSEGGNAFTALQLIRAMRESKASIVASAEGLCCSAATMIFLNAHQCEVSDHSVFMFHDYSGVVIGKGSEMFSHVTHARAWSIRLITTMYKDFLSAEEIQQILEGQDIWMGAHEVIERLKKKAEKNKERQEQAVAEALTGAAETLTLPETPKNKKRDRKPKK